MNHNTVIAEPTPVNAGKPGIAVLASLQLNDLETDEILEVIKGDYVTKHFEILPKLHRLARKVEAIHRDNSDVPHGLTRLLKRFEAKYRDHIEREQTYVLSKMAGDQPPCPHTPISQMIYEHDNLAHLLMRIRNLVGNYQPPESACRSWRRLYRELDELDDSMKAQISLKQDVLYPRFQF